MISALKRILGNVTVEEKNRIITLDGIPADIIAKDISKIWGTSRINKHMFSSISKSKIKIPSFFAIEFLYAMKTVSEQTNSFISRGVLKKIVTLLQTNTWLNNESGTYNILNYDRLNEINVNLLPHQTEFLQQYNKMVPSLNLKGYILAAVPGSGKTLIGISLGLCLEVDAVIIVSPKNAIRKVWLDNIERFLKEKKKVWISDEGVPPRPGMDYYICHYEYLTTFVENLAVFKNKKVMIDLDECHNFNDIKSQRTQAFVNMCSKLNCQHVVWASGTPLKAMAKEMIGFLRTTDPYFTPAVEERFKAIFGMSVGRAADILSHRLGLVSFRVEKSRFMSDKPIIERIDLKMPDSDQFTLPAIKTEMVAFINERMKFYRENGLQFSTLYLSTIDAHELTLTTDVEKKRFAEYKRVIALLRKASDYRHLIAEMKYSNDYENFDIIPKLDNALKEPFRKAKGVYKYVELVIRGEALGGVLGRRRIQCHVAMLQHFNFNDIIDNSEKKTLIFTSYVQVVDKVSDILTSTGYKPMKVYGDTNKNLESIIKKFDSDPTSNPLVATLQSLSTAVPVTSANSIIFLNSPFRVHEREQAISRAHRLGQDTQVYVYDVFLDTGTVANISTRSGDIMDWSKEQIDLIMGKSGSVSVETVADLDCGEYYPKETSLLVDTLSQTSILKW